MFSYARDIRRYNRNVRLFLVYNLVANVGFGAFTLVFNYYLLGLGLREDDIGALNATQTVAMAAAGVSMGFLLNRFGTWRCVAGGFLVFLVASVAIAFAEARPALFALAAIYGIGLAFLFNTTMPFLLDWTTPSQRQQVAAVSFSLISLSITAGSLAGGFLPNLLATPFPGIAEGSVDAYRWTMVVGTAVAAIGIVPLLRMGEARRRRGPAPAAHSRDTESPADRRQVRQDMAVFIAVGGLMSLGVGMVMPFYNVYLITLGASAREVGLVFALGGAVAAVIGLTAPMVGRRFGSLYAVLLVRCSIVPFYLALIFFPSYGLAIMAHLVRQTSISMSWPIDSTFIGELLPPRSRANVFGLRSAAWNLGFSLAAFLGGKVIVRNGYDWTFASIAVFTTLSALLFVGYYRRHPIVRSGALPSALPAGRARRLARSAEAREPSTAV